MTVKDINTGPTMATGRRGSTQRNLAISVTLDEGSFELVRNGAIVRGVSFANEVRRLLSKALEADT